MIRLSQEYVHRPIKVDHGCSVRHFSCQSVRNYLILASMHAWNGTGNSVWRAILRRHAVANIPACIVLSRLSIVVASLPSLAKLCWQISVPRLPKEPVTSLSATPTSGTDQLTHCALPAPCTRNFPILPSMLPLRLSIYCNIVTC